MRKNKQHAITIARIAAKQNSIARTVLFSLVLILGTLSALRAQEEPPVTKQKPDESYLDYMERIGKTGSGPDRILALQTLGEIARPESLDILANVLSEDKEEFKILALEAIANIESDRVPNILTNALTSDNHNISVRAAKLLADCPPAVCVPVFLKGISSDDPSVRSASIQGLIRRTGFQFGYSPEEPPEQRKSSVERWQLWWEKHKDDSPREWWISMISNGNGSFSEVIDAIRQIREHRISTAVPQLITKLMAENEVVRDEAHRTLILLTLSDFNYRPLDPEKERSESVRKWKNWWEQHGEQKRYQWLLPHLTNEDPERISRAAEELIYERPPTILPDLIKLLSSDRVEIRTASQRVLNAITGFSFGYKPDRKPENQTEPIKEWKSWWENNQEKNRMEWYTSVLERKNEKDIPAVNRISAAKHLMEFNKSEVLKTLVHHGLTDPSEQVRQASLQTLIIKTGRNFHFEPGAPQKERENSIEKWKSWLASEQEKEKDKNGGS